MGAKLRRQRFGQLPNRLHKLTGGDREFGNSRSHENFVFPLGFRRFCNDPKFFEKCGEVQPGEPDIIQARRQLPTEEIDVRLG